MRRRPRKFAASQAQSETRSRGLNLRVYFPATFLSASLILSCQPGPVSWKCSRTSRSMRKETSSLALGRDGFLGLGSEGFVVAALNAASAACRGSLDLRVLSKVILPLLYRADSSHINRP